MANLDLVLFRILSIPKHTFIGLGTAPQVALTNCLDQLPGPKFYNYPYSCCIFKLLLGEVLRFFTGYFRVFFSRDITVHIKIEI